MKITSKSRSAVMAMVYLAQNSAKKNIISLSEIAQKNDLSLTFLEQIFSSLKKSGLVESQRGIHGGYALMKNEKEISIFDIIESIDSIDISIRCKGSTEGCRGKGERCSTHHLWDELDKLTERFFKMVTLYHIIENQIPELLRKCGDDA